jgi:hypothetical protein
MLHPRDDSVISVGDRFVISGHIEAITCISTLTPPTREIDRYLEGHWPLKQVKSG